jgi:hypothetical protein
MTDSPDKAGSRRRGREMNEVEKRKIKTKLIELGV